MNLLLCLLMSLTTTFHVEYHPIHVSVCEMNHKADREWLEITIKIFADDFQDVLEDRTGINTKIGTEEEHIQTNGLVF